MVPLSWLPPSLNSVTRPLASVVTPDGARIVAQPVAVVPQLARRCVVERNQRLPVRNSVALVGVAVGRLGVADVAVGVLSVAVACGVSVGSEPAGCRRSKASNPSAVAWPSAADALVIRQSSMVIPTAAASLPTSPSHSDARTDCPLPAEVDRPARPQIGDVAQNRLGGYVRRVRPDKVVNALGVAVGVGVGIGRCCGPSA